MFQTMFNIGYSLIKDKQITCESWVAVWPGFDDGLRGIGLLRGEGHFVGIVTDRAPDDAEGEQGDQGDQERYDAACVEAHRGTEEINDDPCNGGTQVMPEFTQVMASVSLRPGTARSTALLMTMRKGA